MKRSRSPRFQASTCASSTARTAAAEAATPPAGASCAPAATAGPNERTQTATAGPMDTSVLPSVIADVERARLALVDLEGSQRAAVQAHRHLQHPPPQRAGAAGGAGPVVCPHRMVRARQ